VSASTGATACEGPCAFYLGHDTVDYQHRFQNENAVSDSESDYQERQVEKVFQEIEKELI